MVLLAALMAVSVGCGEDAQGDGASDGSVDDDDDAANNDDGSGEPDFEAPLVCSGTGDLFATHVLEVTYGPGQEFGRDAMPEVVLGPPLGGGCCEGSLDVVSLGNGGSITLAFADNAIVDAPGADFLVFENPFEAGETVFAELATVEVSADGQQWHAFDCSATEAPYGTCAGHHRVHLQDDEVTALDAEQHGGDPFDLADVGLDEARFVRITDREDQVGFQGTFDLDAIGIIHPACP